MDFLLPTFLSFITGGGISVFLTMKYTRKNHKIDYADKAVKFMEDIQDKMNERIRTLEARVETLEQVSCIQVNCSERINPYKSVNEKV